MHALTAGTPGTAGLDITHWAGMPRAATDVQPYGQRDGNEEKRLELLARPEPATGLRQPAGLGATRRTASEGNHTIGQRGLAESATGAFVCAGLVTRDTKWREPLPPRGCLAHAPPPPRVPQSQPELTRPR
jgi:hypothetical protein